MLVHECKHDTTVLSCALELISLALQRQANVQRTAASSWSVARAMVNAVHSAPSTAHDTTVLSRALEPVYGGHSSIPRSSQYMGTCEEQDSSSDVPVINNIFITAENTTQNN